MSEGESFNPEEGDLDAIDFTKGPFKFEPEAIPHVETTTPPTKEESQAAKERASKIDIDPNKTHTSKMLGPKEQRPWWDEKDKK